MPIKARGKDAEKRRGLVDIGSCWLVRLDRSPHYYVAWNDGSGTRRLKSCGTDDFQRATALLYRYATKFARGDRTEPEDVRIESVLMTYYDEHGSRIASAESSRIECDRITRFFAGRTLGHLSTDNQKAFVAWLTGERGLSLGTASWTMTTLRAAINHYLDKHKLAYRLAILEPETKEDRSMRDPKGRPLDDEELVKLIAAAETPIERLYIVLLIATLGRPQAVRELKGSQIDWANHRIMLNPPGRKQTKKRRPVVPFIPTLGAFLDRTCSGPLLSPDGKPIGDLKSAWRRLRVRAGLDEKVNPYSIRHTLARHRRRMKIPEAQRDVFMGHVDPTKRMSEIYAPDDPHYLLEAAVEIDRYLAALLAAAEGRASMAPLDRWNSLGTLWSSGSAYSPDDAPVVTAPEPGRDPAARRLRRSRPPKTIEVGREGPAHRNAGVVEGNSGGPMPASPEPSPPIPLENGT
ncbi:MAG TPA: tyrosine-type recombinase/integrase [Alphaproteobacteria bacterium]|nr:tyrosine-type recombinase/integrase [Alphaproteobacteria bacterium]